MPSGSFMQAYVLCPFYKYDDGKRRITCEGIVEDSSLAITFRDKADFNTQVAIFCCKNYKNCEVFRMLEEKYKEDG